MYEKLKEATSICTMSHESVQDSRDYYDKVMEQARMVDAGLITFDEAKRTIFSN